MRCGGAQVPLLPITSTFDSPDVAMARAIAKEIRAASGGLKGVKAMGVLVHGRAQLSMNITDFEATPLSVVHRMGVVGPRGQAQGNGG